MTIIKMKFRETRYNLSQKLNCHCHSVTRPITTTNRTATQTLIKTTTYNHQPTNPQVCQERLCIKRANSAKNRFTTYTHLTNTLTLFCNLLNEDTYYSVSVSEAAKMKKKIIDDRNIKIEAFNATPSGCCSSSTKSTRFKCVPSKIIYPVQVASLVLLIFLSMSPIFVITVDSVAQPSVPRYSSSVGQYNNNVNNLENRKPVIIPLKSTDEVVGVGSNLSFECTARGYSPLNFVWFQDEKNMTNKSNETQAPSSTKLLEEKRYEIYQESLEGNITKSVLNLYNVKITDTSMFLCWVENNEGYQLTNFSLTVTNEPTKSTGPTSLSESIKSFLYSSESPSGVMLSVIVLSITIMFSVLTFFILLRKHNRSLEKNDSMSDSKPGASNTQHDLMLNFDSGDDYSDCRMSSAQDYDSNVYNGMEGFMETMRSGIINIDYHSMSPVVQFNTSNKSQTTSASQSNQSQVLHNQQTHQILRNQLHVMPSHMIQHSSAYQSQPQPHHLHPYQIQHPNLMQVPQSFEDQMHHNNIHMNQTSMVSVVSSQDYQQWLNYQQQQTLRNHGNQQL